MLKWIQFAIARLQSGSHITISHDQLINQKKREDIFLPVLALKYSDSLNLHDF